jgi:hypothetical protein
MKRALLVLAILGALAWIAEAALMVLLPQLAQSSAYVTLATADGYLEWIVPLLGVIVGVLGVVSARRGGAAPWVTLFVTFAVLIVALLLFGFLVAVAIFVLTFSSPNQTLEVVGTVAIDLGFLFPIVVFVTAVIYLVRGGGQLGKT